MSIYQVTKPDLLVSFFVFADMGKPMMVAVDGTITLPELNDINREFSDNHMDAGFQEDGNYEIKCSWYPGQFDEMGRCEASPGWEFDLVKYDPLPTED